MKKGRKGTSRLEVAIWLLCAAAAATAVFGVYKAGNGQSLGDRILDILTPGSPPFSRDLITVLLMGVDESQRDAGRADTLILVWTNVREKKVAMLSVPRDTLCRVKREETKIAHSYAMGGSRAVVRTVEELLGEDIDYYVKVNFEGIQRIVNAMGGVEINVESRMRYTDRRGKLFINLQPGLQRLDGYNAMCYVRYRHDKDSDFGRMRRQKEFLLAAFEQLHTRHGPGEIVNIAYQSWRNLDTNLSNRQVLWLSENMKDLGFDDVKMEVLPVTEGHARGMSVLIPKVGETRETVWELRERVSTGFVLDKREAKVQVLNGTKEKGKAILAARTLEGLGYKVVNTGNVPSPNYRTSKIFATRDGKHCAEEMARKLRMAKVFDKGGESHRLSDPDIFLVVGDDWAPAQPSGAVSSSGGGASAKPSAKASTSPATKGGTKYSGIGRTRASSPTRR